jgi:hypothetical protein
VISPLTSGVTSKASLATGAPSATARTVSIRPSAVRPHGCDFVGAPLPPGGENQIIVDQPIEYDARFLIHI